MMSFLGVIILYIRYIVKWKLEHPVFDAIVDVKASCYTCGGTVS